MTTLSVEERARRRANRLNRKVRDASPLLAYAGLVPQTTAEAQVSVVLEQDATTARFFEWLACEAVNTEERGQAMRVEVAQRVDAETLARLDAHRKTALPSACEYTADFWWCRLRELDPAAAEAWRAR